MLNMANAFSGWMYAKLHPVVTAGQRISRKHLSERICAEKKRKVILVKGQAGFGKSTLLYEVYQRYSQQGVPCVWLNIDEADNDVSRFLNMFRLAIQNIYQINYGKENEQALNDISTVSTLDLLTRLPSPFVIFIDDLEVLQTPSVFSLIRQVIGALPPGAKLILGSRTQPDWFLSEQVNHNSILEIGSKDLRFTDEEISSFINETCQISLTDTQLNNLLLNTEGWPVAVNLAAVAIKSSPLRIDKITEFSGSNSMIAEYLSEEVFSRLPQQLKEFLLKTSILTELEPPLCDAILQQNNSAEILATLDKQNLFLVAIDGDRTRYRYHSLFSRFLQDQLYKTMPNSKTDIHKIAAHYYLENNQIVKALEQAVNSQDYEFCLPLLVRHVTALLDDGRPRLVLRLIEAINIRHICRYTKLKIAHIWAVLFVKGAPEALKVLSDYEHNGNNSSEFNSHTKALRPTLLSIMDQHVEAYEYATGIFQDFPTKYSFARDILCGTLAFSSLVIGKSQQARNYLDEISPCGTKSANFTLIFAQCVEGAIEYLEGNLKQAKARFQVINQITNPNSHYSTNGNAMAGVLLANVLYEENKFREALQILLGYVPLLREQGVPDHLICGYRCQSRIFAASGEMEKAHQALVELECIGYRSNLPRLVSNVHLERARLAVYQGEKDTAATELKRAKSTYDWQGIQSLSLLANETEQLDIGEIRWQIYFADAAAVVKPLRALILDAERHQRKLRALKLTQLLAMALDTCAKEKEALRTTQMLVNVAKEQGFVRLLLDEGPKQLHLLAKFEEKNGVGLDQVLNPLDESTVESSARNRPVQAEENHKVNAASSLLTKKEAAVLNLLAEGLNNTNIAQRMFVSTNTVRTHLRNISAKLNTHSRVETVAVARKTGLIH